MDWVWKPEEDHQAGGAYWAATPTLRFVERAENVLLGRPISRRILQQKWMCPDDDKSEWRDVPLESET